MHHIRATLPDIKQRITTQLQKYNAELMSLGGPMGDQSSSSVVLSVITDFCSDFRTTIDGNTNDLAVNELSGGARISFVFHELFNQGIKTIDPFDQVKDGDIRTILYNSSVRFDTLPVKENRSSTVARVRHQHSSLAQRHSRSLLSSRSSDSKSQVSSAASSFTMSSFESWVRSWARL